MAGVDVATVPEMGWAGITNGALLQLAQAANVDVFVTADQNVQYQQNMRKAQIGVIVLVAPNNRLATLRPLMPNVLASLQTIRPGDIIRVE